jgi:hypothetical protein
MNLLDGDRAIIKPIEIMSPASLEDRRIRIVGYGERDRHPCDVNDVEIRGQWRSDIL